MTRRERLGMVIRGEITEELIAECKKELEKLNERSAAALAKSRETKRFKENKRYGECVYEVLGKEPLQIDEIRDKLGFEIARQRLSAICTNLVREGRIDVIDLKVKGKGKRKGYIRVD